MFKIPKEFTLGGTIWSVEQKESLPGVLGQTVLSDAKVSLLKTLHPDIKEQTFCHELVHCILFSMGKPGEAHDEIFVDGFATFLHQYLKTCKP